MYCVADCSTPGVTNMVPAGIRWKIKINKVTEQICRMTHFQLINIHANNIHLISILLLTIIIISQGKHVFFEQTGGTSYDTVASMKLSGSKRSVTPG